MQKIFDEIRWLTFLQVLLYDGDLGKGTTCPFFHHPRKIALPYREKFWEVYREITHYVGGYNFLFRSVSWLFWN